MEGQMDPSIPGLEGSIDNDTLGNTLVVDLIYEDLMKWKEGLIFSCFNTFEA